MKIPSRNKIHWKKCTLISALTGLYISSANAQGSVTLYGLISEAVTYSNNQEGHSSIALYSGTMQSSRFGFLGNENIGDGSSVVFVLENGFNAVSGALSQSNTIFSRQAFLGLSSQKLGTVTVGRQYGPIVDFLTPFAAAVAGNADATAVGDNDGTFASYRFSNAIKYRTPAIQGLKAEVLYAMSNAPGQFSNNRSYSAGVIYEANHFSVAGVFLKSNNPGSLGNANGALGSDYANSYFEPFTKSPLSDGAGVAYQQEYAFGGQYRITDALRLSGLFSHVNYTYLDGVELRFNNINANTSYNFTPALIFSIGYAFSGAKYKNGLNSSPNWSTGQLSVDYYLSKRTDVYLYGGYQVAKGAKAVTYALLPSSTGDQCIVALGIRHKF